MKKNNHGSVLLVVLLIMTSLILLCTMVWCTTFYLVDSAIKKQEYQQKICGVQSLFDYALSLVRYNKKFFFNDNITRSYTLTFDQWPIDHATFYQAFITYNFLSKSQLEIIVMMRKNNNPLSSASCLLKIIDAENNSYQVCQWHIA